MRVRSVGMMAAIAAVLVVTSCGTPFVPSVPLLSPYDGEIPAGEATGSWGFGTTFDPFLLFFPENSDTIATCTVSGGPVSATLNSYHDPEGYGTDVRVTAQLTDGLGGPAIGDLGTHDFVGIGDTATSASLPAGSCFKLQIRAIPVCLEQTGGGGFGVCHRTGWPGVTFTVDW
jgi:hypothetical protein